MQSFEREQVVELCRKFDQSHRRLIMLFGPRQSGKTTIALQALRRTEIPSRYLAADESPIAALAPVGNSTLQQDIPALPIVPNAEWLIGEWDRARRDASREGRFILVLDEIQLIPDWSRIVKGLWDADRRNQSKLQVVILGSAPLQIQRGLSESLVGRFSSIPVRHWSFTEMNQAFGLSFEEFVYFGGYPGAFAGDPEQLREISERESAWIAYVLDAVATPTMNRDILAHTNIRKPILLQNLFKLAAQFSGQVISFNKMLGQLTDAGNTTTLAGYLHLLEVVGLVAGIQNFGVTPTKRRNLSPKLNVLNTALMAAFSDYSFAQAQADRTQWGRMIESAVGSHLLNTASIRTGVYYWRRGDFEVDFVLKRGPALTGIEVGIPGRRKTALGMNAFRSEFKQAKVLVVGADGIPFEQFLGAPADAWIQST